MILKTCQERAYSASIIAAQVKDSFAVMHKGGDKSTSTQFISVMMFIQKH